MPASRRDQVTVLEVVNQAAHMLDASSVKARPEIDAALRQTVAVMYRDLGHLDEAEDHLRKALALNRQVYGPQHRHVAVCMIQLGYLLAHDDQSFAEAEPLMLEGLSMQRRILGDETIEVVNSMCLASFMLIRERKFAEAERICRRAVAIRQKLPYPEQIPTLAAPLRKLGDALVGQRRLTEAETVYRQAVAVVRKERPGVQSAAAYMLAGLAECLELQGKLPEAQAVRREFAGLLPRDEAAQQPLSGIAEIETPSTRPAVP
jgi:tetratricopeptide (TPR) repeat protein